MVKSQGWEEELQPDSNICIFSFSHTYKRGELGHMGGGGRLCGRVCRKEGLCPWTVWLPQTDRCEGTVSLRAGVLGKGVRVELWPCPPFQAARKSLHL